MPDALATNFAVLHSTASSCWVGAPEADVFREVGLNGPTKTAIRHRAWLRPAYWAALRSPDMLWSEPIGLPRIGLSFFWPSGTTNVTSETELLLFDLTQLGLKLPEPAGVREYLVRHPDLLGVVGSVCEATWDKLGARSQLSLELYRDPEIEDEHPVLYVRQRQYDERLVEEIQALSEEYEADVARTSGWFLVTTDFQPPR